MTLPAHVSKEIPNEYQRAFAAAHDRSLAAGDSEGLALVKGFKAVPQPGRPVIVAKCKLETTDQLRQLFAKQRAAQVFYAWASVVEKDGVTVSDSEGDGWDAAGMEVAAWNFTAAGGSHGIAHEEIADGSELVASIPFTKDLQEALGIDLGRVGWLVGFRVADPDLWDQIEKGELPMLSIGGSGIREAVA